MKSNRSLCLGIGICLLLFGIPKLVRAQRTNASSKDEDLALRRLNNVHIEAQSIAQLFSDLSLHYDIPIGLEVASNDNEFADYRLDFTKGTLLDLLRQLVAEQTEYACEIKDGVVNVFPKDKYRDPILDELLAAEISRFSVKENTSCWTLEKSLIATPEVRRVVETNGLTHAGVNFTGFYIPQVGRHFTFSVSKTTLKSILNKVIRESPVARIWVIKRYTSHHSFYIRLNARGEDAASDVGEPGRIGRQDRRRFVDEPRDE